LQYLNTTTFPAVFQWEILRLAHCFFTPFPASDLISRRILSFSVSLLVSLKYTAISKSVEPMRRVIVRDSRRGAVADDAVFVRILPAPFSAIFSFNFGFGHTARHRVLRQPTPQVSCREYFLNRHPICPGDTRHYRDARRLRDIYPAH
jgi:hypothetical protein